MDKIVVKEIKKEGERRGKGNNLKITID